jgi:hypothetical protein
MDKLDRKALGKRVRTKGHKFEQRVAKELDTVTTRNNSRILDAKKVDVDTHYCYIQCKSSSSSIASNLSVLKEMPTDKPRVVFLQHTKKAEKNFMVLGEYAILPMEDFITIINILKNNTSGK